MTVFRMALRALATLVPRGPTPEARNARFNLIRHPAEKVCTDTHYVHYGGTNMKGCSSGVTIPADYFDDPAKKARFWSKVEIRDDDDCWLWQRATNPQGYGCFASGTGRYWLAHRVAYTIVNGEIPPGTLVRHTCDTPSCVNPRHLELGTPKQNFRDALIRDRVGIGMSVARRVRKAWAAGVDAQTLADEYEVSAKNVIYPILRNETFFDPSYDPEPYCSQPHMPRAKLTDEDVLWARREYANGRTGTSIAKELGISQPACSEMLNGVTWRHLPLNPAADENHPSEKLAA